MTIAATESDLLRALADELAQAALAVESAGDILMRLMEEEPDRTSS